MSNNLHSNWCSFERGDGSCDCGAKMRPIAMRQAKVYFRKNPRLPGMYYYRNGSVRFRAGVKGSHWINSQHSMSELERMVTEGRVSGPIIVNNFQEIES